MFKKEKFNKLNDKYRSHAYTGLMGFFMDQCHKQLENIKLPKKMSMVLEIGAGDSPHCKYLKHDFDEYHIIETSDYALEKEEENKKIIKKKYDGITIPYPNETFDRIIISHCLEHIPFPEKFLLQMMDKLKDEGILSISLPADPGLLFRLGRLYLKLFSIKKNYKISSEEFDYMNATEHVNSIFNLISIIRFNYKNSIEEHFYPFRLKLVDINLFYNVHIYKKKTS
tara:strand:- start:920 stop:1597 length:678 start_codon:yes stop_codon:yes gene_type:complete